MEKVKLTQEQAEELSIMSEETMERLVLLAEAIEYGYEVEVTPYNTPEIVADGEVYAYYVTKYRLRILRNAEEVDDE